MARRRWRRRPECSAKAPRKPASGPVPALASNTTVRASAPCSQGLAYSDDYRILGVLPAPTAGSCNITSLYTARYGSPPVGTKVFVRVNQNIDGWEDVPVELSAIVPAAA